MWGDVGEEGIVVEVGAESHPSREETGSVGLSGRHDAASGRFRRRRHEELRAECIAVGSGHMRQGLSCGKVVSNNISRATLDICILREMVSAMVLASPLMWETSWK